MANVDEMFEGVREDGEVTWRPALDVTRLLGLAFLLGLVFALRR